MNHSYLDTIRYGQPLRLGHPKVGRVGTWYQWLKEQSQDEYISTGQVGKTTRPEGHLGDVYHFLCANLLYPKGVVWNTAITAIEFGCWLFDEPDRIMHQVGEDTITRVEAWAGMNPYMWGGVDGVRMFASPESVPGTIGWSADGSYPRYLLTRHWERILRQLQLTETNQLPVGAYDEPQ